MDRKGFTLVELIVVITILAIILVIAVPTIFKSRENAVKGLNKEEVRNIKEAGKALGIDLDDYNTEIFNCKSGSWLRDRCIKENGNWKKVTVTLDELREHEYLSDVTSKWGGLVVIESQNGNDYLISFDDKGSVDDAVETRKYVITFNPNGGVLSGSETREVIENEAYGELPLPVKENFVFKGWFTENDGGVKVDRKTIVNNSNHTLYARWEEKKEEGNDIFDINSNGTNNDFKPPALGDEGLYEMEDDNGVSYYYRGAVQNNYVKFAGFYWRIIRINGDGSLRIIYDGTSAHANGESSADRIVKSNVLWNTSTNDNKYLGYMFGGSVGSASSSKASAQRNETDSNIKKELDNWYEINIKNKGYHEYVEDSIFCNDRSVPGNSVTKWTSDTGLGYGQNTTGYGALGRYRTGNNSSVLATKENPNPSFKCLQTNDRFTVSSSKGNGALKYPIGLITSDEIFAAGSGAFEYSNSNYYLYKGYWYWGMTGYEHYYGNSVVFRVFASGALGTEYVNKGGGLVPVLNLKREYVSTFKGDGTIGNEYQSNN